MLWRDAGNRFAWIWVIGVVLAFSAISGKNPYYLLPEFAGFAILLALAADTRPRLGIAAGVGVLLLAVVGIGLLRWRSLPVQAGGVLLATALLHAALTPLIKAQYDMTATAHALGQAQRAGTRIAFLGEYQLQFHFAGRLRAPIEVVDEAGARAWATQHPRDLIVVNAREDWRAPGPHPVIQQRFRSRWVQVWRASDWRALPAQQLPLQASGRWCRCNGAPNGEAPAVSSSRLAMPSRRSSGDCASRSACTLSTSAKFQVFASQPVRQATSRPLSA